ncbi:hypothetical protein [Armatimonas rosea]|uniref:Uncharacterized protein n=1 Tax=Armatimonas rosea TaxID=685828 RepID=A0A7W9SU82_ARMRO|nr:hypothetical protein [Armatimonas rosea]MBB6052761.1 hypothetical protein [Armatimonas rosea]
MTPEEITTDDSNEEAFASLLKQASSAPMVTMLPPGLSERIAASTYARPTLWDKLSRVLRPAPARFALAGALTAATLSAVFLPRLSKVTVPPPPGTPAPLAPSAAPKQTTPTTPSAPVSATPTPATPAPALAAAPTQLAKSTERPATPESKPAPKLERATPAPRAAVTPMKEQPNRDLKPQVAAGAPAPLVASPTGQVTHEVAPTQLAARTGSTKLEPETAPTPAPAVVSPVVVAKRSPRLETALASASEPESTPTTAASETEEASRALRSMLTSVVGKKKAPDISSLSASRSGQTAAGTGLSVVRADVN